MVYINEIISEHSLALLCVTETWLYEQDFSIIEAKLLKSHMILHIPRPNNQRGGGVAIIYSRAIKPNVITPQIEISSFESMSIAFSHKSKPVKISVIYRPGHPGTDNSFLSEFNDFLEWFLSKSGTLIMCGDFNYWIDNPGAKHFTPRFIEMVNSNNCTNHINSPTHVDGHTLDLLITPKNVQPPLNILIHPIDNTLSDHALLTYDLELPSLSSQKKTIQFRNYRDINIYVIKSRVEALMSPAGFEEMCADELTVLFNEMFKEFLNEFCPLVEKTILIKDDSPWFDNSIIELRKIRRRAERVWRSQRTDESKENYVTARRAVVQRVSSRKSEYYRMKIDSCNGDSHKLWKLLNSLRSIKSVSPLPSANDMSTLASDFGQYFSSKIDNIRIELDNLPNIETFNVEYQTVPQAPAVPLTQFNAISDLDTRNLLREITVGTSCLDPINFTKIVPALEAATPLITAIINKCFTEGLFPISEKAAAIRPSLKNSKLDKDVLKNYRPISNLTLLSKIIEKAILNQLMPYLEFNSILPCNQSAYRKNYSTETAMCRIYNDLIENVCLGKHSVLVLLDLSAAFDTIDQPMLLTDLFNLGIGSNALSVLKSYLANRSQSVHIADHCSEKSELKYGVPQGSVLGPVLFSIYVAGLGRLIDAHHSKHHFYADDTQLYIPIETVAACKRDLDLLLSDIKLWMSKRKLKLNDNKTEVILIHGNMKQDLSKIFNTLNFGGHDICPASSVRDIGVIIESNLSFDKHISKTISICNFHIRNLYAIRSDLDRKSLLTLVHALVTSHIDYCNSLYMNLPKKYLKKLQTILNRSARLIFNLPPRHPTTSYLIELHWLSIKARIEFKVCLQVYKALKYSQPKYLRDLLILRSPSTDMVLRCENDPFRLLEPRAYNERTFAERSFAYSAPRLYNKLPIEMKQLDSIETFKSRLKTFLFQNSYDLHLNILKPEYKL